MYVHELFETTTDDEDPFALDDSAQNQADKHESHIKAVHKALASKYENRIKGRWVTNNKVKRVPSTYQPRPGEKSFVLGRATHVVKTTDPKERASIDKDVERYQHHVSQQSELVGSLAQVSKIIRTTKTRTSAADKLIIAAASRYSTSKSTTDLSHISVYLENAVHEPWPEFEPYALITYSVASTYWKYALHKKSWPRYQSALESGMRREFKILAYVMDYLQSVIRGIWAPVSTYLEHFILKHPENCLGFVEAAVNYAKLTRSEFPNITHALGQLTINGGQAYTTGAYIKALGEYAKFAHIDKWPQLENKILKLKHLTSMQIAAFAIARDKEWVDGEHQIFERLMVGRGEKENNTSAVLSYCAHFRKKINFNEKQIAEPILQSAYEWNIASYCTTVGVRWLEFEKGLKQRMTSSSRPLPPECTRYIKKLLGGDISKLGK